MNIIDLNEEQIDEIETRLDTYDENYITYNMNGSIQIDMEDGGKLIAGLDACVGQYDNAEDSYSEYFFLKKIA